MFDAQLEFNQSCQCEMDSVFCWENALFCNVCLCLELSAISLFPLHFMCLSSKWFYLSNGNLQKNARRMRCESFGNVQGNQGKIWFMNILHWICSFDFPIHFIYWMNFHCLIDRAQAQTYGSIITWKSNPQCNCIWLSFRFQKFNKKHAHSAIASSQFTLEIEFQLGIDFACHKWRYHDGNVKEISCRLWLNFAQFVVPFEFDHNTNSVLSQNPSPNQTREVYRIYALCVYAHRFDVIIRWTEWAV